MQASTLCRANLNSMTATLSEIDDHAQTDGSLLTSSPIKRSKLSSKRAAKKLAIGLMLFLQPLARRTYEMDLSQV